MNIRNLYREIDERSTNTAYCEECDRLFIAVTQTGANFALRLHRIGAHEPRTR